MKEPPSKRLWFRFSLRTLFVVVTVAAVAVFICTMARPWRLRWSVSEVIYSLKVESSKADVLKALGEPLQKQADTWTYPDGLHDPYVIDFDDDGKLMSIWQLA